MRQLLWLFAVVFSVVFSTVSMAHVKWFVDGQNTQVSTFQSYSLFDWPVIIWAVLVVGIVSSAIVLDKYLPQPPPLGSKVKRFVIDFLSFCCGLSLLVSTIDGALIAPHLLAVGSLGSLLLILQGVIGFILISNRFMFQGACLLLWLYVGLILLFGLQEALEYANIFGIALFILFSHCRSQMLAMKFEPYAIAVLRIATGVALISLGISEKLMGAQLGQLFLRDYAWNFMANFGFDFFSDQLFVLSAGMMEVIFGTILVLGVVTRLNTCVIACFMLTSNLTFLFEGNLQAATMELFGHLPIIASALVFIFCGGGDKWVITPLLLKKGYFIIVKAADSILCSAFNLCENCKSSLKVRMK